MLQKTIFTLAACAALTAGPALAADTLNGAGGTAIYPVLSVWAQKYNAATGVAVNYQAIGSGGGVGEGCWANNAGAKTRTAARQRIEFFITGSKRRIIRHNVVVRQFRDRR